MIGHERIDRVFWSERGSTGAAVLDGVLFAASLGFEAGVRLRNRAFGGGLLRRYRAGCPVVCIGNLTVGGSGKTPLVAALAAALGARGDSVAVLSRGYGGRRDGTSRIVDSPDAREHGDEPAMLARAVPTCRVIVGPDRVQSARVAVNAGATVIVLDDGFQHRRLERDVDILVVDGSRGFGNGFLLPRGPLREPPSAIRRASLVMVKSGSGPWAELIRHGIRDLAEGVPVHGFRLEPRGLVRADGTREVIDAIARVPVAALSGIGNPSGFVEVLRRVGADVVTELRFGDHHRFRIGDLRRAEDAARRLGAERIVTTTKDLAKLGRFVQEVPLVALDVQAEPDDGFDWIEWVAQRLAVGRGRIRRADDASSAEPFPKTPVADG